MGCCKMTKWVYNLENVVDNPTKKSDARGAVNALHVLKRTETELLMRSTGYHSLNPILSQIHIGNMPNIAAARVSEAA